MQIRRAGGTILVLFLFIVLSANAHQRVTISNDGQLNAWDKEGKFIAGWPKDLSAENRFFTFTPRLVDTDFDLQEEIVAVSEDKDSGNLRFHVFKGNGEEITIWRFDLPYKDLSETPIIADVNHDSSFDVIFSTASNIYIYRRNQNGYQKLKDFSFESQPFVAVGDPDNNGLEDLFIASGNEIKKWNPIESDLVPFPLPTGPEKIIGAPIFVDVNHDLYPDLVYVTDGNHLVAVDRNGTQLLNVSAPASEKFISTVIAEDIDIDRNPELIVLTDAQNILAYETDGTLVSNWKQPLFYRQPLPSGGVVANDIYEGLFSSATGWDLYSIYRNKLGGYSRILLGENVHDFDAKAEFNFIEPVTITDAFAFPKLFTPNNDNTNDDTQIHYRLSDDALISLDLYDSHKRFISHIFEKQTRSKGEHQEIFQGIDTKGTQTNKDDEPLSTGTYIVQVVAQSKEGFITSSEVGVIVNGVKAEIESPTANVGVFGKITVSGIALDPNFGEGNLDADFKSYKLYYRPGIWNISPEEIVDVGKQSSGWQPLVAPARNQCTDNAQNEPNDATYPNSNVSCRPVQHGELGTFNASDAAITPNGEYTILLKVMDSNGNMVGKVNYDTRVVNVHNALASDPLVNPNDLFDPRNPNNPLYQGPKITGIALSSNLISREKSETTISYKLENETANIHIDIFPYNGGALGSAVSAYSFNKQAPADYTFKWNGTNTLGRNVDGGHYKIRITANAIDGTGSAIDESLELDVAKGYSARDVLKINSLEVTPDSFNPFGFGGDLEPETATISFGLTKDARVTLQIFDAKPEEGGKLQKTLMSGQTRKADAVVWDGSADNGVILTAGRSYFVRLTAVGIDVGNDEKIVQDISVALERPTTDAGIPANLMALKGDQDEYLLNDGTLGTMTGSPDFIWRAKGTGYVQVPFNYSISASGTEDVEEPYFQTESRPMYTCYNYFNSGEFGNSPWNRYWLDHPDWRAADLADMGKTWNEDYGGFKVRNLEMTSSDPLVSFEVRANDANGFVYYGNEKYDLTEGIPRTFFPSQSQTNLAEGNTVHVNFYHKGDFWDSSCVNTGLDCPNLCVDDNEVYLGTIPYLQGPLHISQCKAAYPTHTFNKAGEPRYIGYYSGTSYDGNDLYQCGNITVKAQRKRIVNQTWPLNGQSPPTTSSDTSVNTLPNFSISASFSASVGSQPGSTSNIQITDYQLSVSNTINGITSPSIAGDGNNNDQLRLLALRCWLDGGSLQAEVLDNAGNRLTEFKTERDDPWTLVAPYNKIWGRHSDFNRDEFHDKTDPINIYSKGYRPNIYGGDGIDSADGRNKLYTFSDVVHIDSWDVEVRYPNISVDKLDGDNPLDTPGALNIFKLEGPFIAASGIQGNKNSNIEDNFRLKLLPEAQPKRFVEIHGSAAPNYELYYYDGSLEQPKWVKIPVRTDNAVTDNILAHWDVTKLNGRRYTVVLKTTDASTGKVNQDIFSVGIGTEVDTSKLKSDERSRVDSTFKRASLLFGPDTLENPELITINPVPKNDADFSLPNGVTPLGPIFDIKPDHIQINPSHHVQLEMVLSVDELKNTFGVADPSEVQIYNLAGDELLEGLATTWVLDTHNNADSADDIYRFTAFLEHFSQYILVKKQIGEFKITSPSSSGYLKGETIIAGRFEKEGELVPVENLKVSYGEGVVIYEGTESSFNIPWDVSSLNGNFILIFEAKNAQGESGRYELPVAIDNSSGQSILLVNGEAIADGEAVTVGSDSIIEIKANDTTAGVEKIEYGWDGGSLSDYIQPATIPFKEGIHIVAYRAVDKNGNIEPLHQGTIQIKQTLAEAGQTVAEDLNLSFSIPNYSQNAQTWVNGETQFEIEAQNIDSSFIKYRANRATYQAYEGPFNLNAGEDGLYTIEYYSVDGHGLRGDIFSKQVILDATAPVSSVSAEGDYQKFGDILIVTPETKIILKAVDGGIQPVGLSRIEYRFDNGNWEVYRDPLQISALKTLAYRAIDKLGNIELEKTVAIKLDDTAPIVQKITVPSVISPNGDGRNDTLSITIAATDNFAKDLYVDFDLIASDDSHYKIWDKKKFSDATEWTGKIGDTLLPEAVYTYELKITDAQGNVSDTQTGTLVYDLTPPKVIVLNGQILSFSPNGDALSDVLQVAYTVEDNLSKEEIKTELHVETAEGFEIRAANDSVDTPPANHQFSWDGTNLAENPAFDGTYRFTVIAEDLAGNRSVPKSGEVQEGEGQIMIDRLAPDTLIEISDKKFEDKENEKTWINNEAKVRFDSDDPVPGSGVREIQYALGDSALQKYLDPFTMPMEGVDYKLRYQAVDVVGNKESEKSLTIRLDKTAPTTEISVGEPKVGDDKGATWISPVTPLNLQSEDPDGSGVKKIFVETPEVEDTLEYTKPFSLVGLGDGLKHIYYWAEDQVGNSGSRNILDISLDGTPPVTELVIGEPKVADTDFTYITSATPLDFKITTERNDLKNTEYKIDESDWLTAGHFKLPKEKPYTLNWRSHDLLENIETTKAQKVVVDDTPPDPKTILNQGDGDKYVTRQTLVSLDPQAVGVGTDVTEYKIDNGAWQTYKDPFGLTGLGAGSHTILYRSRDKLGNMSPEKKLSVELIDVVIERQDFLVPRTLVFLLQTFDLRADDPRPNADLLKEMTEEMGGYYQITENVDEFINLVRSDRFTTYILATDSLVVNFSDDPKLIRIFKELKSRIDKGEALINLTGFAQVSGPAWDILKSGWSGGDGKPLAQLGVSSQLAGNSSHYRYGDGHIVSITANAGAIAKANDTDRESVKSALQILIEEIRPRTASLNAGEVVDTTLTFTNSGDQPVVISVKEIYPTGGTIETADTKGEVPIETRDYEVTVPALDKVSIDYLYQMPFEVTTQKLVAEITAKWKSGVSDKVMLESNYNIEKDLNALMASISLPPVPTAESKVGKSAASFSNSVAKEGMLDAVLGVIDNTSRSAREAQLNLDEAVQQIELAQVASAESTSGDSNGANNPSTFNGPTASFAKGTCSLNTNAKADWSWLMWIGFILFLPFVRGELRWGRVLLLAMTIAMNAQATDTGLMGIDRQLYQVPADQTGIGTTVGTEVPKELKPRTGVVTNVTKEPITIVVPATNREFKILDWMWNTDFLVSTGYWDHLSVGLAVPVYFYLNGTDFNTLQSFNTAAMGDIRFDLKYRLWKETKGKPAVAIFSRLTFPTGSQAKWTGDRGVTWEYRFVADKTLGRFQVFANAGMKVQKSVTVFSSEYGDAFTFGTAARYQFPWQQNSWAAEVELSGKAYLTDTQASSVPLELRINGRKEMSKDKSAYFGVGKGLTDAVGSPDFRIFGGFKWEF